MDSTGYTSASSASAHTATSHRRKLIKKPPSYFGRSSSTFDGGAFDAQSLESKRSSQSLKRAPSAPPARSNPATVADWQDSDRSHPQLSANNTLRPVPSPISPQGDLTPANHWAPVPRHSDRLSDSHLRPLNSPGIHDDLIGAPFDGAGLLSSIESIKIPSPKSQAPAPRHFPPQIVKAPADAKIASPALRTANSFSAMDSTMNEKGLGPRAPTDGPSVNPKRYSDDGKDSKPAVLRKKSGFSGFMNSLVGSPKKPVISAPENPVHVTHVGYDSSTGQFTVSISMPSLLYPLTTSRVCRKNGSDLSTKVEFLKRNDERTRKLWLIFYSSTKKLQKDLRRTKSSRSSIMLASMPPLQQLQHHRACTRQTIWVCHQPIFHLRTPGFQLSIMKEVLRIPEHHHLYPEARLVKT